MEAISARSADPDPSDRGHYRRIARGRSPVSTDAPADGDWRNVCWDHAGPVAVWRARAAPFRVTLPGPQPRLPERPEPGWNRHLYVPGGSGAEPQAPARARACRRAH